MDKIPSNKIAIQLSLPKKATRKKTFRPKKRGFPRFLCCTSLKVWVVGFQPNFKDLPSTNPLQAHPTPLTLNPGNPPTKNTKKIHPHKMVHKQSTDGEDADTYLHMVLDLSIPENIHPGRFTAANLKPWWRFGSDDFPFLNWVICRFYVNLPGCSWWRRRKMTRNPFFVEWTDWFFFWNGKVRFRLVGKKRTPKNKTVWIFCWTQKGWYSLQKQQKTEH